MQTNYIVKNEDNVFLHYWFSENASGLYVKHIQFKSLAPIP